MGPKMIQTVQSNQLQEKKKKKYIKIKNLPGKYEEEDGASGCAASYKAFTEAETPCNAVKNRLAYQ